MKLVERDQYIHWHRLKDEDVVRDIFWCHPDAVKLCNACNLVFLIDSTNKRNRYKLRLLDFVGVTPTGMTFSAGFAYLEGERVNNMVWALERFQVSHRQECQGKMSLIGQKNAWKYVMDAWGSLVDCRSEHQFDDYLKKFEIELDFCGKVTLKSKLREISYPDQNSMCPPPEKVNNKGMDEDSWSLVRNHLLKELSKWSDEYVNLFGGIDRFEELKRSLLVDGLFMVTMDKWMDITDMGYVIASRYNVYLRDRCPLPPLALLWSRNCHSQAK
ncbi:hypothetical protein GmHk_17G049673 [Glycine max]|nr:hypothetical protein GmHk_17G049673 [Glycine max]